MAKFYKINSEDITYRIIDNEAVILNLDNGYYYSLNEVGTRIWEAIDKRKNLGEILDLLKEKYHMSEKQLKDDLLALAKDLEKEEIIEKIKFNKT